MCTVQPPCSSVSIRVCPGTSGNVLGAPAGKNGSFWKFIRDDSTIRDGPCRYRVVTGDRCIGS
ncbi:hypothetical protein DPMN_151371 [Dreissena polymorpha]|uniref:Uncharacterized protein n=1 Tax=Dreissena polymorpha TaxID=45954 RepID=A0A9D4FEX9_DREPO|nr:hypothetical protein DPMN_151371 [Dreissena polymorpha]